MFNEGIRIKRSRSCFKSGREYQEYIRKILIFLSPLRLLKFFNFLNFLFILKLSCSKPFHNTLNYVSTANIEKVMKFYNLGDKTNRL